MICSTKKGLSVWQVEDKQEVANFMVASRGVAVAAFVLGDTAVLTCDRDGVCEVRDIKTKQSLMLENVGSWPEACWPNENGSLAAIATEFGRSLKILDLARQQQVTTFTGHIGRITSVVFFSGDRRAITAGADRTIRFWDVENGEELLAMPFEDEYRSLAISPDEGKIAFSTQFGTGVIDVVRQQDVTTLAGHKDVVRMAFLGPNEEKVYTASDSEHFVWDAATGNRLDEPWPAGAYEPHLKLAASTQPSFHLTSSGKTVVLSDLAFATGETEQSFRLTRSTPSLGYFSMQIARAAEREDPFAAAVLTAWRIFQQSGSVCPQ